VVCQPAAQHDHLPIFVKAHLAMDFVIAGKAAKFHVPEAAFRALKFPPPLTDLTHARLLSLERAS
jgi:hypothetical protein